MLKTNLFGYEVEIDAETTAIWYAAAEGWGCTCGHCRNFLALASESALPSPVIETLSGLNIAPEKATYVCEMTPEENGFLYQFSYRIAGSILSGEEPPENEAWGNGHCCHEPYPYGAPGFPTPHFDLEFWVTLPWVLEESPNG